jgi:hypothetical protein
MPETVTVTLELSESLKASAKAKNMTPEEFVRFAMKEVLEIQQYWRDNPPKSGQAPTD